MGVAIVLKILLFVHQNLNNRTFDIFRDVIHEIHMTLTDQFGFILQVVLSGTVFSPSIYRSQCRSRGDALTSSYVMKRDCMRVSHERESENIRLIFA